ncbi:phage terminase small subunit [Thalassospira marina]|uniref:Terminase n=1 Tax=Thalassospira marina TaxID=2048283 RepID=A0A2N3KWV6_9PROT|nr:phage terminase small subunit [Thalassospira marina]PKR55044.1 terminase [Thalassospira marina]
MASIARRHFEKILAAKAAGNNPIAASSAPNIQERIFASLKMHQAQLKNVQSLKAKIDAKREFLRDYVAYVDGILAAGNGAQDDILITIMIWRLDCGDYEGAFEIAAYALRHNLKMPERFKRDLPTSLVEEIADNALNAIDTGIGNTEPVIMALRDVLELTEKSDMPDEVRAKAHKALGKLLVTTDQAAALNHLKVAFDFDPKCGVKTQIAQIEKQSPKTTEP